MSEEITHMKAEITRLKPQVDKVREEMQPIAEEFIAATIGFIEPWYHTQMRKAIESNPKIAAEAHANGKLKELKQQFETLVQSIPQLVRKELDKDGLWGHRMELPSLTSRRVSHNDLRFRYGYGESHSLPDDLQNAIRSLTAPLGKLLDTYNLRKSEYSDSEWEGTNPYRGTSFQYKHWIGNTEGLFPILDRYGVKFQKLLELDLKIKTLEDQITKATATNLWDQA